MKLLNQLSWVLGRIRYAFFYSGSLIPYVLSIAVFLLRFICNLFCEYNLCSDAADFWEITKNLIAGNGFLLYGKPTAYRMPLFPVIMALFGMVSENLLWLRTILALYEVTTGIVIYLLCKEHFGKKAAIVSLTLWSFMPVSIVQPLLFMSEVIFNLLFTAMLLIILRPVLLPTLVLGGLLCGLQILVKQHMLIFPGIFIILLSLHEKHYFSIVKYTIIFGFFAFLTITPWIIRNKNHFGSYTLSTNSGQNLYIGNNTMATGSYYDIPVEIYSSCQSEADCDRMLRKKALEYIFNNPIAVLKRVPKKLAFLFSTESSTAVLVYFKGCLPDGLSYRDAFRHTPIWLHLIFNFPYFVIMISGVWAICLFYKQSLFLKSVIVILFFWIGVHSLYFGTSRFHYPLLPLMVVAATSFFGQNLKNVLISLRKIICASTLSLCLIGVWCIEFIIAYR